MKRYDWISPTEIGETEGGSYAEYEEAATIIAEHISTNRMLTAEGDRHRQIIAEKDKEIVRLQLLVKELEKKYQTLVKETNSLLETLELLVPQLKKQAS